MENKAQALPQAASRSLGSSLQKAIAEVVHLFRAQWHYLGGDTPYNKHRSPVQFFDRCQ